MSNEQENLNPPPVLAFEGSRAFDEYRRSAIAGFLRTRRAGIDPDPTWPVVDNTTARRVRGLRREEVAWSAGLSVDYYTKLEQGRAGHPSSSVVDSLSSALHLRPLDRRYLRALTSPIPPSRPTENTDAVVAAEAALRSLANQLHDSVMLHLLSYDLMLEAVDARTAYLLFPTGQTSAWPGRQTSLLTYIFSEPNSKRVYVDWADKAREVVGLTHMSLATTIPTARLLRAINHTWHTSPAFRYIWSRYEPHEKDADSWRIRIADEVTRCDYATYQTSTCRDISLVVYRRSSHDRDRPPPR